MCWIIRRVRSSFNIRHPLKGWKIMNLEILRNFLNEAMPLLDKNLSGTHDDYMAGKIPRGAYEYTLSRHANALNILSQDIGVFHAHKVIAQNFIDLQSAIKFDIKTEEEKLQAQDLYDRFLKYYQECGFTEMHEFFNIPILPEGTNHG